MLEQNLDLQPNRKIENVFDFDPNEKRRQFENLINDEPKEVRGILEQEDNKYKKQQYRERQTEKSRLVSTEVINANIIPLPGHKDYPGRFSFRYDTTIGGQPVPESLAKPLETLVNQHPELLLQLHIPEFSQPTEQEQATIKKYEQILQDYSSDRDSKTVEVAFDSLNELKSAIKIRQRQEKFHWMKEKFKPLDSALTEEISVLLHARLCEALTSCREALYCHLALSEAVKLIISIAPNLREIVQEVAQEVIFVKQGSDEQRVDQMKKVGPIYGSPRYTGNRFGRKFPSSIFRLPKFEGSLHKMLEPSADEMFLPDFQYSPELQKDLKWERRLKDWAFYSSELTPHIQINPTENGTYDENHAWRVLIIGHELLHGVVHKMLNFADLQTLGSLKTEKKGTFQKSNLSGVIEEGISLAFEHEALTQILEASSDQATINELREYSDQRLRYVKSVNRNWWEESRTYFLGDEDDKKKISWKTEDDKALTYSEGTRLAIALRRNGWNLNDLPTLTQVIQQEVTRETKSSDPNTIYSIGVKRGKKDTPYMRIMRRLRATKKLH